MTFIVDTVVDGNAREDVVVVHRGKDKDSPLNDATSDPSDKILPDASSKKVATSPYPTVHPATGFLSDDGDAAAVGVRTSLNRNGTRTVKSLAGLHLTPLKDVIGEIIDTASTTPEEPDFGMLRPQPDDAINAGRLGRQASHVPAEIGEGSASEVDSAGSRRLKRRRRMGKKSISFETETSPDLFAKSFDDLVMKLALHKASITRAQLVQVIQSHGLQLDDTRLVDVVKSLNQDTTPLTEVDVEELRARSQLLDRALLGDLVVPKFQEFVAIMEEIYEETMPNTSGKVADYIPQLANVNPDQWAVAVCTIDGQRSAIGDSNVPFCVQSCSKPITYMMGQTLMGPDEVHKCVGKEASGRNFNELCLNDRAHIHDMQKKRRLLALAKEIADPIARKKERERIKTLPVRPQIPHNPMINAGAIMATSFVHMDLDTDLRFDKVMSVWEKCCGYSKKSKTLVRPTFANSVFLSERRSANRNFCLGYMMKSSNAFKDNDVDLNKVLESYFMYCAIECTTATLSVVAATLANGGICPVTDERVFSPQAVQNCLSIMYSCGMYDFSGEFAFTMGFPCKSGVAGSLMIVIPGVCGFATWSPRIDQIGNSVRGVEFCRLLIQRINFHNFETLGSQKAEPSAFDSNKFDPRQKESAVGDDAFSMLLWACARGDVDHVRHILAANIRNEDTSRFSVYDYDYDGRSPLHIAMNNNRIEVVEILLRLGADLDVADRFGVTPRDVAANLDMPDVSKYIEAYLMSDKSIRKKEASYHMSNRTEERLYSCMFQGPTGTMSIKAYMAKCGIREDDPRMQKVPPQLLESTSMSPKELSKVIKMGGKLIEKMIGGNLTVPKWSSFVETMTEIFNSCRDEADDTSINCDSRSSQDRNVWGAACCTIDGQQLCLGDSKVQFAINSIANPINYGIVLDALGREAVFEFIGREPSGRKYDEVALDTRREIDGGRAVPHNPMVTAGGLMSAVLFESIDGLEGASPSEKEKYAADITKRLAGSNACPNTDDEYYHMDKAGGNRAHALMYIMEAAQAFPDNTNISESLDLFFRTRATMMDTESLAVLAATLAGGGRCPLTGEQVFHRDTVQDILTLMFSCGMYDYSGEWAFTMGIPSKASFTGCILLVVPNVCGLCIYSPGLDDELHISSRGMHFCHMFTKTFAVHMFEGVVSHADAKIDMTAYGTEHFDMLSGKLIFAAFTGDVKGLVHFISIGGAKLLNTADYDRRTALHLACAEGRLSSVEVILKCKGVELEPLDHMGKTPLMEAQDNGFEVIAKLLTDAIVARRKDSQKAIVSPVETPDTN